MFIFKIPKMIFIGIIIFMVILAILIKIGVTLPKDEILNVYDSIIQTFSSKGLSKDKDLKGERNFGVDEYVGTYKAEYDNYTGTETVFGGTALHRKNGDHIKLTIKIKKQSGNINVISKLGENELSLISDDGEYEDTIYIDGMSYYLSINLDNFKGSIYIISE